MEQRMSLPSSLDSLPTVQSKSGLWPKFFRRDPMELVACGIITLGILMLLQPFAMVLYTWSFVTMLFGTVMFMVVSKFPQ
jgi:hypothetical protein